MHLPNNEPAVALHASAVVAHSPSELQGYARPSKRSANRVSRQLATVLFCAGMLGLDLGAWELIPGNQEKHAAQEVLASSEEAAITRLAQASLANSTHPLLTNQAREARLKIEQADARAHVTMDAFQEFRTKRMRLMYLFCGIGTLLIVSGVLVRLSA